MNNRLIYSRRDFLFRAFAATAILKGFNVESLTQLQSFDLTLRRDHDLPSTLGLNDCVMGKLYQGTGSRSDPGTFLCDTLELPFRNELKEISCVKAGNYSGFIRTDPTAEGVPLGWRIQLKGTTQLAIQIHPGNITENTRGCILVGTRDATACKLKGGTSGPARDKLKALYGDTNSRPIRLIILS